MKIRLMYSNNQEQIYEFDNIRKLVNCVFNDPDEISIVRLDAALYQLIRISFTDMGLQSRTMGFAQVGVE